LISQNNLQTASKMGVYTVHLGENKPPTKIIKISHSHRCTSPHHSNTVVQHLQIGTSRAQQNRENDYRTKKGEPLEKSYWWWWWWQIDLVKVLRLTQQKDGLFQRRSSHQSFSMVLKKPNPLQQKQTCNNKAKDTKHKTNIKVTAGLVPLHDVRPETQIRSILTPRGPACGYDDFDNNETEYKQRYLLENLWHQVQRKLIDRNVLYRRWKRHVYHVLNTSNTPENCTLISQLSHLHEAVLHYYICVRRSRGEMYRPVGHGRLCVCLSLPYSHYPVQHRPGCNLGEW